MGEQHVGTQSLGLLKCRLGRIKRAQDARDLLVLVASRQADMVPRLCILSRKGLEEGIQKLRNDHLGHQPQKFPCESIEDGRLGAVVK